MNKIFKNLVIAAIIILPALANQSFAQKKVMLKYKLEQGKVFKYKTDIDQDITFDANGQEMSLNQIVGIKTTSTIENSDNEGFKLVSSIDAMRMEQSIFGMDIVYDSEDPETQKDEMAQKIGEALTEIIGAQFSVTYDAKGNILESDLSALSKNEDISNNLNTNNNLTIFPDNKVAVGDSWEREVTPLNNSDMKTTSKYTVNKITRKQVVLDVVSTISSTELNGTSAEMTGTITGQAVINRKTGWTMSSEMDMEMTMQLEQNGMSFPGEISGTISYKPLEK